MFGAWVRLNCIALEKRTCMKLEAPIDYFFQSDRHHELLIETPFFLFTFCATSISTSIECSKEALITAQTNQVVLTCTEFVCSQKFVKLFFELCMTAGCCNVKAKERFLYPRIVNIVMLV